MQAEKALVLGVAPTQDLSIKRTTLCRALAASDLPYTRWCESLSETWRPGTVCSAFPEKILVEHRSQVAWRCWRGTDPRTPGKAIFLWRKTTK